MKIKTYFIARQTLEEFTAQHHLAMLVYERKDDRPEGLARYYCSLEHIEIKDDSVLISPSGNGNTVEEAIEDYCRRISGKRLVYRATNPAQRRDFMAPMIKPEYTFDQEDTL